MPHQPPLPSVYHYQIAQYQVIHPQQACKKPLFFVGSLEKKLISHFLHKNVYFIGILIGIQYFLSSCWPIITLGISQIHSIMKQKNILGFLMISKD